MATKLYFGNLSYGTTDDALRNAAAAHGTVVSASVIKDKFSGRSKGFGFVEMSTEEEAQAVISAMHETEFEGRKIIVNEARPEGERSERKPRREFNGPRRESNW